MIGADPAQIRRRSAQLRELAKTMSLSGQQLDKVAASLQGAVAHSRWQGPDSERFRQQWASQIRPTLRSSGAGLEDVPKLLLAQAAEQETASSDNSGGAGSGAGSEGRSWDDIFTDPNYSMSVARGAL